MNTRQAKTLKSRVICALDVPTIEQAIELVDLLDDHLCRFKVGSRMFTRYGPALVDELAGRDLEVFVDLKFHDIPNTVAGAVESACELAAVFMMTVHASGGPRMIERAVQAAASTDRGAHIVAVTALTSLSATDIDQLGVTESIDQWAGRLGRLAVDAGADGLVCSAHEAEAMRRQFGAEPLLVTPGIRPEHQMADGDDQSRVTTPADALAAGSDFLVIGRPIYQADDPLEAVIRIGESL